MATKQRIKLAAAGAQPYGLFATSGPAQVVVADTKPGTVGWADKLKGWYKGLIAAVGAILVLLNNIGPFADLLGGDVSQWVTVAISALTAAGVFLRENEHWVDAL
jgi:hypothetical protein